MVRKIQNDVICMLLALTASGALPETAAASAPGRAESSLSVAADPRIELLAAVQLLSGYEWSRLITRHDFPYKRELAGHFDPWREHEAVTMFAEMSRTGFSFDAPVAAVLHLGPPPELPVIARVPDEIAERAGGRAKLDAFVNALRDFVVQSDFVRFHAKQTPFYDAITQRAEKEIEAIDIALLESYYGIEQRSYTIILAPLFHPGGFGPRIESADGRFDIYSVVGPQGVADNRPTFGTTEDFRYLIWHEFSHSFINPLVDAQAERIDACAILFSPLESAMRKQAYQTWRTCVYEHLVRAATCRFAALVQGDDAGRTAIEEEVGRSFVHVPALCAKLQEYESNRDRYPTLQSFFPELIAVFEQAARDPALIAAHAPPIVEWSVPEADAVEVDPALTEIVVQFSQDMQPGGYSWTQRSDETFPEVAGQPYWKTARICVLPVKLEPGRTYWIGLNSGRFTSFRNERGIAAREYVLEFTTRKEVENIDDAE